VFRYDQIAKLNQKSNALTKFTTKEGLVHIRSMCIYEDKAGGIWIGTEGGISYYDEKNQAAGYGNFRNFTIEDGLTHNSINTIMEDKTGKLWVGTRGTLCVYEPSLSPKPGEIKFIEIKDGEDQHFENIWSIIEDNNSNIWLGGQFGLWRFDGNSFTRLSNISVMSVLEDKKGNIWFTHGTNDPHKAGLSHYDNQVLQRKNPKLTEIYIGDGMFFEIAEDKDGNIWVGTLAGVFRYDGQSVSYFKDKPEKE
jgi:ligand-binding sensor domain-containing protein